MQASTLVQGLIITLADRYDGNGTYKHDNGAGEALRLLRPMSDGNDWYCSHDLTSNVHDASWNYIVHVDRLKRSEVIGFCLDAAREAACAQRAQREARTDGLPGDGEDFSPQWLNEPQSDAGGL